MAPLTGLFLFGLYKVTEKVWDKAFDAAWEPVDDSLKTTFQQWGGKGEEKVRMAAFAHAAELARRNTLADADDPSQTAAILDALNHERNREIAETLAEIAGNLLYLSGRVNPRELEAVVGEQLKWDFMAKRASQPAPVQVAEVVATFLLFLRDALLDQEPYAPFRESEIIRILRRIEMQGKPATQHTTAKHRRIQPPAKQVPIILLERAANFRGREEYKQELLADLLPGRTLVIGGPGGIGKTTLVAEVLWEATNNGMVPPKKFPDGVISYSFYNQPQIELAFEHIIQCFGTKPQGNLKSAAQRILAGKRLLLVLDGAEVADDLMSMLEIRGNCGVLITSREIPLGLEKWSFLPPLEIEAAVELLHAWGGERVHHEAIAKEICNLLGRLPLAVQLAGSYMRTRSQDAWEYLEWLKETPLQALDFGGRQHTSIPALLEKSLEPLRQTSKDGLALMGLLAFEYFDAEIIAAGLGISESKARQSLGELVSYGLIQRVSERYRLYHSLIYTYAQTRLTIGREERLGRLVDYCLNFTEMRKEKGMKAYEDLDRIRRHLLEVLMHWVNDLEKQEILDPVQWQQVHQLAKAFEDYLAKRGHFFQWETVCEKGLRAAQVLDNHETEEFWLGVLGLTYYSRGRINEAQQCHERALEIARGNLNKRGEGNHLSNLGSIYLLRGPLSKAIEFIQQAYEISESLNIAPFGRNTPFSNIRLAKLGLAYIYFGTIEQGITHCKLALARSRQDNDLEGEITALSYLGIAYLEQGEVEQTIVICQQALEIVREKRPRDEANALSYLGQAYLGSGKPELAVHYLQQALMIARRVSHRRGEGVHLGYLGSAFRSLGEVERAFECHREALTIARELGDKYFEGTWLGNIGHDHRVVGNMEEALTFFQQALTIFITGEFQRKEMIYLQEIENILYEPQKGEWNRIWMEGQLINILEACLQKQMFPGCAALVYSERTRPVVVTLGNYLFTKPSSPVDTNTIFDLASLTKVVVTTTAIMQLVERGEVNLSDPVRKYIPEFIQHGREAITLWHLLTHTDGLGFFRQGVVDQKEEISLEKIQNTIFQRELLFRPGSKFLYTDTGFILLGWAIENITGMGLDSYAHQFIFQPLGMARSYFNPPSVLRGAISPTTLEVLDDQKLPLVGIVHDRKCRAMGGVAGHAGVFSTIEDVYKFAAALIEEDPAPVLGLSRKIVTEMFRNQLAPQIKSYQGSTSVSIRQGLGWWMGDNFMGRLRGENTVGHTGFTGTSIVIDLESRMIAVLLSNNSLPHPLTGQAPDEELRKGLNEPRSKISDLGFKLSSKL